MDAHFGRWNVIGEIVLAADRVESLVTDTPADFGIGGSRAADFNRRI